MHQSYHSRIIRLSYVFHKVDDGTLEVSTATVVGPVSGGAAGAKSGRREGASATTGLSHPGLYSTEKLYAAKNDSHLAIRCERCELFMAVRKDSWSV